MNLKKLSGYIQVDEEKTSLIDGILHPPAVLHESVCLSDIYVEKADMCECILIEEKYCPKCNTKYSGEENFCIECGVRLKKIEDKIQVRDIKTNPKFTFKAKNSFDNFDEIFVEDNFLKISELKFTIEDYDKIIKDINKTALKNMDNLIKANELSLDDLDVLDSILLFAKSFVDVDYKSYGQELGYFEFDRITVDDRQTVSLQITTIIHELAHFLLKEIITRIICKVLDCTKNSFVESIAIFILSYSPFTQLIDEYSAHTVEGRFTIYGYQDYSSFIQIERSLDGEMDKEDIEITKSIGNTFANSIKDILESFIDWDLREDIKKQFRSDVVEGPNYKMLVLENCNKLSDDGLIRSIWLILTEGFAQAALNVDKLIEYEKRLDHEY
ncbi:zinc ribbon domain-containing protein [Methanobrevibacter sp.]|uniref:zinc ribbon domain-containing protein n=1 Tax=Methanobrevibacter sp. TaxID=66852 RepID=UPI003890226B